MLVYLFLQLSFALCMTGIMPENDQFFALNHIKGHQLFKQY